MWWIGLAFAGKADNLSQMLADGKTELVQKKCERMSAFLPETEPAVREVCARAMLPLAEKADTFAGWVRFQNDWAGTSSEKRAREGEAAVRLRGLGSEASETEYATFLSSYADTASAAAAELLKVQAAVRSIDDVASAKRVATDHPTAPGLIEAVAPYFDAFVTVQPGPTPTAQITPPLTVPGHQPLVTWAGRVDDTVMPWDEIVLAHLGEEGLPASRARLLQAAGRPFPPCSLPGAEVGVRVQLGSLETFVPQEVACGGQQPGFISVRDGRIVGLSIASDHAVRFAGADGGRGVRWGTGEEAVVVPLLGGPGQDVIPLGSVIGEQIGGVYLVHPVSGGLPWYVVDGPPPTAQPLPLGKVGAPLPEGVEQTIDPDGAVLTVGGKRRVLPAGAVRPLSPMYQELTGLHDGHDALGRVGRTPFEEGFWPEGAEALPLEVERQAVVEKALAPYGVRLTKGWQVQLASDPALEVPFEGVLGTTRVRGIIDPKERSEKIRLFVVVAPDDRTPPQVFRHAGRTHVGWLGEREGRPALQVMTMTERGLEHTWLTR